MAHFSGTPIVELLDDGRRIQLHADFAFIDDETVRWDVPKGAIVDGASIPRLLWTPVGGPLEGRYRNASVIHDWYCDIRSRPWRKVHRVFYEAMIVSGVGVAQAKAMYAAVYFGGPRWNETVVHNQNILNGRLNPSGLGPGIFGQPASNGGYGMGSIAETRTVTVYQYELRQRDKDIIDAIESANPPLDEIEAKLDGILNKRVQLQLEERTTTSFR